MPPRSPTLRIKGQAALYLAATTFAFVSLCVRLASRFYPGLYVSAARFMIGALLCIFVIAKSVPKARPKNLKAILFRGLFGSISMVASYAAISMTGVGRATLLSNTYPLFVALFSALFFRERVRLRTIASLVLCTVGAVLVVRDGSGASLAGDLLAIGSAVLAGLAVNYVRIASEAGESPFVLYLSPCLFGLPLFAFAPVTRIAAGGLVGVLLLLAVGLGAFLAQALMSWGYRTVPASRGSVVFYWETVLTVALGLLFGGESLNWRFALGLVVILFGLWLNHERAGPEPAQARQSTL